MRILFAADGSRFTKKALAFLVANDFLNDSSCEIQVLHVQTPLPPRVKSFAGRDVVNKYQLDESEKVLEPIRKFLARHDAKFTTKWTVGHAGDEIIAQANRFKANMIVMGTHGYGSLGRIIMGSVAQKVVAQSDRPVLLVQ
jgi:nucleotide-binding universal stress UspA family protein